MKVTIITVCFNSTSTIEGTIQSVLSQDYTDIEYLIIDGVSTDGTLEKIQKYKHQIAGFVSEKDKGLYDAINKGILMAKGDLIGLLHSDDIYQGPDVISQVVKELKASHAESLYADLLYVDKFDLNKVSRFWKSKPYKQGLFQEGWMPPHPTFFVKREVYNRLGLFNLTLKSAADYELMLRFLHKNKISVSYLPRVIIKMRVGGKSNVSFWNRLIGNREDRKAWEINGLKPGLFTMIRKPLSKISQFYKRIKT
jgi:glycosyltransferase involved in cell wall biosynthesis